MAVIAAYDISSDEERLRAARKLEYMGYHRLQRSLWVHPTGTWELALKTLRKLSRIKLAPQDKIHIIHIPPWSYNRILSLGKQKPPQPPPPGFWEPPPTNTTQPPS